MSLFHIIRNTRTKSLFKDIIQGCIHSNIGDTIYISSGFYQEEQCYSAYNDQDSRDRSFANYPNKNSLTVNIIGIHSYTWKTRWDDFIDRLKAGGYNVNDILKFKHHAKVFIYEEDGTPLLEIIGSSNITSRAYGTTAGFNTEADLVICNCDALERQIKELLEQNADDKSVMVLNFDNERNHFSVEDEMKWIRDNLFKQ